MSAVKQLSILALASTVLATPYGHGHGHGHKHLHSTGGAPAGYGSATGTGIPYPYPTGNSTGPWGSTGIPYSTAPVGYGSSSSVANPNTATEYNTQTKTIYQTVYAAQSSSSAAADYVNHAAADSYGTGSADSCAVVTVTATEKVTQYVTEGAAPSSSSSTEGSPVESSSAPAAPGYESSNSTEAAPVETSSTSVYSAPAYSAPAYTPSTEASPETTSTTEEAAAPSYSDASSSTAAPVLTASYAVKQEAGASKTASAPASYSSTSSSSSGKRGLAYNDASLTSCFSGAREVSWAYNWGSSSDGLDSDYMFIPTLWGTSDDFVGSWSENAKSAISSGSTHLFSFNEPDHSAQANLGYAAAATAYAQYMNPFKGQAQLCAPSVTNGGGEMGLTWLKNFLGACTDCHIDCINIHWYDSAENTAYFKKHVEEAIELADGKPVYISEFGATGSDDQIKSFLEEVMPWMDSNSNVAGYAYFMVKDGMLVSGTEPSTYGSTYKTYTS